MNTRSKKKKLDAKSWEIQEILSDSLNRLCLFLHDEYSINAGGCCYIVYCLAKLLKADKFDFTVIIYNRFELSENKFANLRGSYNHYALGLGDFIINSGDCENRNDLHPYKYSKVKVSDLLNHYMNGNWNDEYDKTKNEFLFKVIKTFYADFTKSLREE